MKIFKLIKAPVLVSFLYVIFGLQSVYGDDTEIFFTPDSNVDTIIPNVLFVIDTSGSMTGKPSGETQSKIKIVKNVMDDVLTNINGVNVGLMRYNKGDTSGVNSAEGGPILFPATYIDDPSDPVVTSFIAEYNDDAEEVVASGSMALTSTTLSIGASSKNIIGLRFQALAIPQGATIESANIVFTANGNTSGTGLIKISAELSDNAVAITGVNSTLTTRAASRTLDVHWAPSDWSNGSPYSSVDLSSMVQTVVNRSGWCGGNNMMFFLVGDTQRDAYSIEGSEANSNSTNFYPAPKITIKYKNILPTGATGCTQSTIKTQISHRKDDWEKYSNHHYTNSSGDLDVYYKGTSGSSINDGIGISFKNLNIPKGATIKSANIILTAYRTQSGTGKLVIKGVNDGNPNSRNYSALYSAATLGSITWPLNPWSYNEEIKSPDITSIVQSIVDLSDWNLGNTMAFYLQSYSGRHSARSYNSSSTRSPKLQITYKSTYEAGVITKREEMRSAVADLPASGYTPISDVMAEAGLYYRGEKVYYGIDRDNQKLNLTSHADSYNTDGTLITPAGCSKDNYYASACAPEKIIGSPNYVSPITESCQTSHIVFLTDGYPTSHHAATQAIYNKWSGATCSSANYGTDCAKKIAGYLSNNDQNPNVNGRQTVTTHTIGFDVDFPLLQDMADAGGGNYYTAATKDGLIEAIKNIVASIASVNTSFVSSGVSVNQYNRLTHNDELYFSLFAPASKNIWPGNIKRYKLSGGQIVDSTGASAVDPTNGEFNSGAQSYWSAEVDGNDVEAGGVASLRGYGRKVFSNISGTTLTNGVNAVRKSNTSITDIMINALNSADRDDILDWAQGLDVSSATTQAHNIIGDPLHSQPTVVIYNTGSESTPNYSTKVYVGTNHGFLHSFDSDTGVDDWSFIPKDLLPLLTDLQKNVGTTHSYGLDGSIAIYIGDTNNNGVVDSGEKAYLYVGMRRGGTSYYALDISDNSSPKLLFKIQGGTGSFSSLAETWSTPIIKRMNIGGVTNRLVLIFGGGYDTAQDLAGTASATDTEGNVIYIADATTGAMVWSSALAVQAASPAGSLADMNSVPADISAIDLDGDNLVDSFYAADTKGQIFRFDVDNDTQIITGGKIASIQTAADKVNNRRFYYTADTALIRTTSESFISISIGSGYRAHPLDTNIEDNFYMIKDKGVLVADFDMMATRDDLVDITALVGDSNADGQSDAAVKIENTLAKGWYLDFSTTGEKVVERSVTFNNAVLFTTYIPPGNSTNVCEAAAGNSRVYALSIVDGNPFVDNNFDGVIDVDDRYTELDSAGIAPAPQILLDPQGVTRVCIGTECGFDRLAPTPPNGIMGIRWWKN